ncbi:MAG: AraC family transcriptional regulator [Proteobacteria bacterium]|nr:AraC family transcriptional regulator [Pseudomonadota bacterium]
MSTLGRMNRHLHVQEPGSIPFVGSARIAAFLPLPEILSEFGIDVRDVMREARVQADIFDDPDNLIPYPDVGRLLSVSARHTSCDYIGLLVGQRSRSASLGLAGQVALCADTVGQGLRNLSNYFTLQNTAATVSVITSGGFTRFVYAIAEPQMGDTRHIQLGAIALAFNILQELCGSKWLPIVITVASKAPSNLRPCQKFFRAPVRFDSDETALVFDSQWLEWPLPSLDPLKRRQIEAEVRARHISIMADFPTTFRRVLRKQLFTGEFSMDSIAALLGIHRRTLDRRLKQHDMFYSEMLMSVKCEVACQLLRDTHLKMQQVAESLQYVSAANFSTAFRRWTGLTPSAYRRQAR